MACGLHCCSSSCRGRDQRGEAGRFSVFPLVNTDNSTSYLLPLPITLLTLRSIIGSRSNFATSFNLEKRKKGQIFKDFKVDGLEYGHISLVFSVFHYMFVDRNIWVLLAVMRFVPVISYHPP